MEHDGMLNLSIERGEGQVPPIPDESDGGVTVWTDPNGAPCAYGRTVGEWRWIHIPPVGAFRFQLGSSEVTAFPLASAGSELVVDAFNRTILPLALQALGHEVLHASAVLLQNSVVAICAVSGTGKSTIARALAGRGHQLWADDAVCFDATARPVTAVQLPFALRLRPASAAFFGAGRYAGDNGARASSSPAALGAVVVLERQLGSATPTVHRLGGSEAFIATLTHGYAFDPEDKLRNAGMVRSYLELVDRVPVLRLTFSPGLEGLTTMVELLEQALGNVLPSAA
jgi:hypothetical protein